MIAKDLISTDVLPLKTSDDGEVALGIMNDFYISHLPIVNDKQLLGVVSEDDIFNHDATADIGSYAIVLQKQYVHESAHIFEVLRVLHENQLSAIPVVDEEQNYLGLIRLPSLLSALAKYQNFDVPGAIIILELGKNDYSLTELARIIEAENSAILYSSVTLTNDSTRILVTLKLNKQDIQHVVASLQRFGYNIHASFQENQYADSLKERYDSFLHYLNI